MHGDLGLSGGGREVLIFFLKGLPPVLCRSDLATLEVKLVTYKVEDLLGVQL